MRTLIYGAIAILILTFVVGVLKADDSMQTENLYFFADQAPYEIAQNDDPEWGTASGLADFSTRPEGYKSRTRAVLYSLLMPGLGEIYVGDTRTTAAIFIAADAGIWSTVLMYRHLGKWKRDDYIEFATVEAGADPEGKDDHYFDMLGFHNSRDDYNKVSRVYTRTHPFFPETPEWDWQWQSDSDRERYRDMKNDSRTYYRVARYAIGAAVLNRAVSAFFAWRGAKSHNRRLMDDFSQIRFEVMPPVAGASPGLQLNFTHRF